VALLRTLFSHRVQPLHQRLMTMRMYLGPSCPNRPFSVALGNTEFNTWIRGVLAQGADLNLGSVMIPLRERVDNPRVSSLGFLFGCMC
jgi:hypothetical protein